MNILLTCLLCLLAPLALAEPALHTDLPLAYREQPAAAGEAASLVILLHGYGSNEQDLLGLADELPGQATYLSVRAPMALDRDAYQWFTPLSGAPEYDGLATDVAASEARLLDFIAAAAHKYQMAPADITLVGFSQGAIISYQLALRHPHSVGAVAALSGKILPALRSTLPVNRKDDGVRWFIAHGTADAVLPVSGATQADQCLRRLGIDAQVHIYPGLTHSISPAELADLRRWLQR
jgi:phospholipase/carboxylesterase